MFVNRIDAFRRESIERMKIVEKELNNGRSQLKNNNV